MSAIISGAGGASCQLCTATLNELKHRELLIQGFPINIHITDAIQLFGEIEDNDSFLYPQTVAAPCWPHHSTSWPHRWWGQIMNWFGPAGPQTSICLLEPDHIWG